MRIRSVLALLFLGLLAAFAALNWPAFNAPTRLNLLAGDVEAPLGLVMLGVLATAVLALALQMVVWQGNVLREGRRQARELQAQRRLADQAEASRFSELQTALQAEMAQVGARLDDLQSRLSADLHDNVNSLAALIGELDHRLGAAEAQAAMHA